jgi:hypothetical protein
VKIRAFFSRQKKKVVKIRRFFTPSLFVTSHMFVYYSYYLNGPLQKHTV